MKIYTQLLKLRIFRIQKAFIQLLIILFFALGAGESFAQDKVLNLYFCGSGCAETWWLPNHQGWEVVPELVANLHYNDVSSPINKIIDPKTNIVTDVFYNSGEKNYKYIVNGIGYGRNFSEFLSQINADMGARGWEEVLSEGILICDKISSQNSGIILNLIGFSRGGILCMKLARSVASNDRIKKINILAFDPVPGDPDPIYRHGNDLRLPAKVKQYVGVYARDERSLMFEPLIPDFDEMTKDSDLWLVSIPGGHETMVGNCQLDGHSVTITLHDFTPYEKSMKHVNNVVTAIAEQLITSKAWGGFENKIRNLTQFSNKNEFQNQIKLMYGFKNWGPLLTTSFITIATLPVFSGHDLFVYPSEDSFLRLAGLAPKRLCFKAPYRYSPSLNHDQVFWLDKYVDSIKTNAWDKLQSLRGDYEAPVPDVASLPDLIGECAVNVNTTPTATDAVAGSITGSTDDPLEYTEQGTYTVTWSYDDGNGNVASQEQTVIVEDVTPPVIDELLATSFTIYPSNYKSEEVPQWPVNFKSNKIYEWPRSFTREDILLLKHQRKYETIAIHQLVESVSDNCSNLSVDDVVIKKVTCDEAEDSPWSSRLRNKEKNDIIISEDCKSVDLKREFDFKGNGRVYTVYLSLQDEVGNETIETCQFQVLFSALPKIAIADTPVYETPSACYEANGSPTDVVASVSTKSSLATEKSFEKEQVLADVGFVKNYPNPFNSNTTFTFGVAEKSDVSLSIYNMKGQLVRVLYSGTVDSGTIHVDWDGTGASGNQMTSGVYIYRLLADNNVIATGKAVLRK